jgi:hypothetical protein
MPMRAAARAVVILIVLSSTAHAQPSNEAAETQACFDSFEASQDLRENQQLLAAREQLERCAASDCPDAVRTKCIGWVDEVRQGIPTVVVSAVQGGAAQTELAVFIDGEQRAASLDGLPIEVDPGSHTVRVERSGHAPMEQKVVANHGEKSQPVRFELASAAPPVVEPLPAPKPAPFVPQSPPPGDDFSGGSSATTVIGVAALGLGGVALVVGGITGAVALSAGSDLEAVCTDGSCPATAADDYDTGTTMADVSTITFIAGGVLVAAGVTLVLVGSGGEPSTGATLRASVSPRGAALFGTF